MPTAMVAGSALQDTMVGALFWGTVTSIWIVSVAVSVPSSTVTVTV